MDRLYRKHVPSKVLAFGTHLSRYSLQATAGNFLENEEVTEPGLDYSAPDLRLIPDMFVAQIAGDSREPMIPDGSLSLCVLRAVATGSRDRPAGLGEHKPMP